MNIRDIVLVLAALATLIVVFIFGQMAGKSEMAREISQHNCEQP